MTHFFVDLWHDLREKRLWPVAVGLLAAIVAVPVILFKPASDAAPPATVVPKTNGAETLPVVSVDDGPSVGSRLEAYSEKNPFKPMKDLAKAPDNEGSSPSPSAGSSGGADTGTGGTFANPGGSSSGGSSGSPSGGSPSVPGVPGAKNVKWFRYVADFSFGETGAKPTIFEKKGSFTLLPDEKTPSIVFVGIDGDHKHAMFFVNDPGFEAHGEGKCNATGACQFVMLSLSDSNDEETFSATDGSVSYDLKLLKITREELDTDGAGNPVTPPKNGKASTATGAGVAAAAAGTESVAPAVFAAGPGIAREQ